MSPRPEYILLCGFLDVALRPFSHLGAEFLSQETEKELLIALSQVFTQVKKWTHQLGSQSKFDPDEELDLSNSGDSYLDNRHCLAKIIGDLVFLLAVNNPYAQHLVGNTLLASSKFVIASGSSWKIFMHLLCFFLELTISSTLSSSRKASALPTKISNYGLSIPNWLLTSKPESAKWYVVTAIIRVLRNILKYLKQDGGGKNMKVYLDSVGSLLLNVSWDFLSEIIVDCNAEALRGSDKDVSLHSKLVHPREMEMLCGNLLQFLCSFVDQIDEVDDGVRPSAHICQINDLVLKLVDCCHDKLQNLNHISILQYSRHKILMLMVKLSSQRYSQRYVKDIIWIHLIHKYFEDLLFQPLSGGKPDETSSVEDSPFCSSISEPGKLDMLSHHLQRLATFVFLKFSLNLVSSKENSDKQCTHEDLRLCLTSDRSLDSEYCAKCQGLSDLQKWLQVHVPADTFMYNKLHFDRYVRFTRSFLQLYIHEDDILFQMLLQFFCLPFNPKHQFTESEALLTVKNHKFFLASLLFNPLHLFHLFLAEILYDHQVLLDYLISGDTGSSCAEYLLRSLRLVCDSWDLFLEFPGVEEGLSRSNSKRQKVLVDSSALQEAVSPANIDAQISGSIKQEHNKHRLPFLAARDCLISLRISIESLNQRNLFPYNPQVLLRRLFQFEELCAWRDKF
ncbi:uncharacterized protein [Primulina eburnea]|uniref:uncharacterized protein isoform X1 n=2 Tax=Primulina eburnea TaxID=1245227 RepID=UPI003C6CB7DD